MQFALPLVSVIISNYNYGRFLADAVRSVQEQGYGPVECIVVDDASTDDSAAVLAQIERDWPAVKIVRHHENAGQGVASRTGLEASRGPYVVFMDSDDVLAADFVATHVYVHLSARVHPGLTSSDIYQVVDGQVVSCAGQALNDQLLAQGNGGVRPFRPMLRAPEGPWTSEAPDAAVLESAVHVPAGHLHWCWSPTTANMFRRDAVALFAKTDEFAAMRIGLDVFLCTAVGHRCGSVLIDRPLSMYRIHGANLGSYRAQLTNVRAVYRQTEMSAAAFAAIVEIYTRHAGAMLQEFWTPESYMAYVNGLEASLAGVGQMEIVAAAMERHRGSLTAALGNDAFSDWMARRDRGQAKRRRRRWLGLGPA
jgi:glycosyltransferase involved in cell wall biosynthesis